MSIYKPFDIFIHKCFVTHTTLCPVICTYINLLTYSYTNVLLLVLWHILLQYGITLSLTNLIQPHNHMQPSPVTCMFTKLLTYLYINILLLIPTLCPMIQPSPVRHTYTNLLIYLCTNIFLLIPHYVL